MVAQQHHHQHRKTKAMAAAVQGHKSTGTLQLVKCMRVVQYCLYPLIVYWFICFVVIHPFSSLYTGCIRSPLPLFPPITTQFIQALTSTLAISVPWHDLKRAEGKAEHLASSKGLASRQYSLWEGNLSASMSGQVLGGKLFCDALFHSGSE